MDSVLKGVNVYSGFDIAIDVVEARFDVQAMALDYDGISRCGMSPWDIGSERECYEGQQQNEQTASDACNFHDNAPHVLRTALVVHH